MCRRSVQRHAVVPPPTRGAARGARRAGLLALLVLAAAGCARFGAPGTGTAPSPAAVADPARAMAAADAAYAAQDWPGAAAGYRAAARALGTDPLPWFKLGNVYFRDGRHDLAAAAYEEAVRLAPDHAKAWHNLGVVRLHQADADLARAAERAASDDPATAASARGLRATLEHAIAPTGAPAP